MIHGKTIYTGKAGDDGKTIFVQGKEAIESTQVRFVFADTNVEVSEITLTPYVNWAMKDAVKLAGQKKSGGDSFTVPNSVVDGDRITKGLETGVGGSSDTDRHEVTMTFSKPKVSMWFVSLLCRKASLRVQGPCDTGLDDDI